MSTILERIIASKKGELIERKTERSQADLETEIANASLPAPRGNKTSWCWEAGICKFCFKVGLAALGLALNKFVPLGRDDSLKDRAHDDSAISEVMRTSSARRSLA